jgi:hypothetical protein
VSELQLGLGRRRQGGQQGDESEYDCDGDCPSHEIPPFLFNKSEA